MAIAVSIFLHEQDRSVTVIRKILPSPTLIGQCFLMATVSDYLHIIFSGDKNCVGIQMNGVTFLAWLICILKKFLVCALIFLKMVASVSNFSKH